MYVDTASSCFFCLMSEGKPIYVYMSH